MRLVILTAALLAGCNTMIPAHQASNTDVCRNLANPEYAPAAQAEATRRGLDCRPYLAQRQAESNALGQAAQFFNRPAPMIPFPTQTNCRSVYRGYGIYDTVCN